MDKKNGNIKTHKKCREKLLELLNVANLTDSWRLKHPDKRQYTWHSNSKPHIHCRLDYFLISDNIINILKDTSISPGYKTDHSLVSLTLSTLKYERGPGYFKLNNSILTDENYQNNIRKCIIDTARNNNNCNANTLWEVIKGSIRNETIKYTTYLKKRNNNEKHDLLNDIEGLESRLYTTCQKDVNKITEELIIKKEHLDKLIQTEVNGNILRAKATHVEYNEKNSKYFANLEKKRSEGKSINKLKVNNETITEPSKILDAELNYYTKLYSENKQYDPDNSTQFLNNPYKTLNEEEKLNCEGLLTSYECELALKDMKNNKSPGSDGLTAEFYKMFWKDIHQYLINSLNFSFNHGHLTQLQK